MCKSACISKEGSLEGKNSELDQSSNVDMCSYNNIVAVHVRCDQYIHFNMTIL